MNPLNIDTGQWVVSYSPNNYQTLLLEIDYLNIFFIVLWHLLPIFFISSIIIQNQITILKLVFYGLLIWSPSIYVDIQCKIEREQNISEWQRTMKKIFKFETNSQGYSESETPDRPLLTFTRFIRDCTMSLDLTSNLEK